MKRFAWPLQRLLDIAVQREQALRGELAAMAEQIDQARRKVMQRRALLRHALDELDRLPIEQRLVQQPTFLAASGVAQRQIEGLEGRVAELKTKRQDVARKFMKVRSQRQTLEKLRQRAMDRYRADQARLEQKQSDEVAGIAFVCQMNQKAAQPSAIVPQNA